MLPPHDGSALDDGHVRLVVAPSEQALKLLASWSATSDQAGDALSL
jgi:hypothetical protein